MKKLWSSKKTEGAQLSTLLALGLAVATSVIYYLNYTSLFIYSHIPYAIGFLYGTCATLFVFYLLPILIVEHKTNLELKNEGYSLAKNQNISVIFNPSGTIDEIFYEDMSYKNNQRYKQFYHIDSKPVYYNPQLHKVYIAQFPTESFAVLTERLPSGQIVSTVYDRNGS